MYTPTRSFKSLLFLSEEGVKLLGDYGAVEVGQDNNVELKSVYGVL